ncbi:LOW QUALITY PROTEIN: hypothetical protein V1477_004492 [Vespula maculifrons]|uniref:Uncharacterized protein n=1 Tax=Vespula maculifrons TaxID=7453 RepID=A0ABD2CM02_VESMC
MKKTFFFKNFFLRNCSTQENRAGVVGKGSSRPEPSYNGLKGTKEKNIFLNNFFLRNCGTYENRIGVFGKGSSRPVRPYFFRPDRTSRSRVITHLGEPDRGHWKGLVAPSTTIFFSSRSDQEQRKKNFFSTIFFSETIAPRRTGPDSLERARHAHYAHIFLVKIGPTGADTQENRAGVVGKGSSRPVRPYFFRPDRANRSRVITGTKEKTFFLTIFFSETVAPTRIGSGSLERARRALYAHIFFVQIGPHLGEPDRGHRKGLVAPSTPIFFSSRSDHTQEYGTGVIGKGSSLPIRPYFFRPDQTNRSRVITENRTGVIGKGSSLPIRPYFFRPDRTNRSRVITHLGEPDRVHWKGLVAPSTPIFFSSRSDQRTGPGSLERARRSLYAHIFFVQIGPENRTGVVGKGSSLPIRPYFFRPDWTNRSRVITHPGVPHRGHWKGLVAPSRPIFFSSRSDQEQRKKTFFLTIFFSETVAPTSTGSGSLERAPRALTQEYGTGVIGKGSSLPIRPYYFRPDQTNRSRPRRTGPGSLERACRSLYAHIFFVQIGPHLGEPDRGHWKGLVAPSTPIFFSSRSDQREPSYNAPRRTGPGSLERARRALYAQENRAGVVGKGSLRPVRPYFFRPDRTNRSRVITHPGVPYRGHWQGLIAPYTSIFFSSRSAQNYSTQEYRTGVTGKGSSRPVDPYFFRPDRTSRSRLITHPGEPGRGHWKGLVAPSTPIFFSSRSDQRTGPGSLERARRSLYAHIFFVQIGPHLGEPDRGHWKGLVAPSTPIFFSSRSDHQENRAGVVGKGSSRPVRPYFFRPDRTNRSRVITEYRTGVIGKGSSLPIRPYFFRPHQTNRSSVMTYLGEPDRGHWKGLVAPSTPIFFTSRSDHTYENRIGVFGKGSSRPVRVYFFRPDRTNRSRVITHLGEPDRGRWKGLVTPTTPIFFSSRSDQREPSYNGLNGKKEKTFFFNNFFLRNYSTQEYRTEVTGKGSSRPVGPYFFRPDRTSRSRLITHPGVPDRAHRRTVPGSLERARRALYAHIFFVQIGPIGADTYENPIGVFGKGSSRPVRPYFFRPDRTNRSRVITEYRTGVIGKGSSLPIRPYFFRPHQTNRSRVITHPGVPDRAPTRTGSVSLERARRALYSHIFFVHIRPIGADTQEYRTGVIGKGSSRPVRPYFFRPDQTNRSRVITHPGEPDQGSWKVLVAPCAPIFFSSRSNHTQEYPTGVIGKCSSRPIRPYFLRPDQTNRSPPRRMAPGSLERARRALTEVNRNVVVGKGSSRPLRAYFFRPDRTNRSRVITHRGEPDRGRWKVLVAPCAPIFFSSRWNHTQEYRTGVIGKGSSLPIRPYFFRPDQTNRSRVITHLGEPDRGHWKGLVAPSTPIFFSSRSDQRTGPGSLERARRSLYAHIFFVQIGPHLGEPDRGRWKGLVTPTTPIFFSSRSDQREPSYNGLKGKKEKTFFFNNFFLRNYSTQEYRTGVTGKGSSRRVGPYFFRPDRTSRSRLITYLGEPDRGHWKGLVAPSTPIFFTSRSDQRTGPGSLERARRSLYAHIFFVLIGPIGADTQEYRTGVAGKGSSLPIRPYFFRPDQTNRSRVITEYRTGVAGKGSSLPIRPYFFRPDQTNRSRVITHLGERYRGHWKGLVAPSPRRTGPVSLERARRSLYAHIFFVLIGPIGADTQENQTWVMGKGSLRPLRPYFFRPDRTNRSRVITVTKEKKHFSLTIFFSETIAPTRTGSVSLERARRDLYAHIFFVQIGPIGAELLRTQEYRTGVAGKGSSLPIRPYFFRPDQTNRSRVITHPGEPDQGSWKVLVAPCAPIFFSSRSNQ